MDRADFKGRNEIAAQNVPPLGFPVPHLEVFPVVSQNADVTNWYLVNSLRTLRNLCVLCELSFFPRARKRRHETQRTQRESLNSSDLSILVLLRVLK
jgi:hypothetical protein